jgi:hypothetical protein
MMPMQMLGMAVPMAAQAYATKNPESGIAKSMDAIMMLSMLTMILPMLNSPLKLLAATAVGLTIVFKMQAATIKKSMIEGQKQAEAMSMTTKNLEELGIITSRVAITQTAAAKRAGRNTDLSPVSMDFGANIISTSEFGKNLKKTFNSAIVDLGEGAAVNSLVNQLGTAVSQGVLNSEQAQSIAIALTRDLKDARLEVNVRGRLIQLLGPNGKNVLDNPLQVQLELVTTGEKVAQAAIENLNKVAKQQKGINTVGEGLQLAGGTVGGALIGARAGSQVAGMVAGRGLIAQEMAMAGAKGAGVLGKVSSGVKVARTAGLVASGAATATGVGAPFGAVGAANANIPTGTSSNDWFTFSTTVTIPADGTAEGLAIVLFENAAGPSGAYIEISQVKLEIGSSITPITRSGGTIAGELAACQRYYWRTSPILGSGGYARYSGFSPAVSSTGILAVVQNPVPMRIRPTSIDYLNVATYDNTNIGGTVSSLSLNGDTTIYQSYVVVGTSGLTQYRPYQLMASNTSNSYLGFSAEL